MRKGKKREVEKRDSPQAQDHQAKWGGQLMSLPYAWTKRKEIEEIGELAARQLRNFIQKKKKEKKKRRNNLPFVQWQIRGEE